MSEHDSTGDRSQQRVSDAERHQVVEALQRAAGDGRLDVEELEERLEATWAARTYADLLPILADLPYDAPRPADGATPAVRSTRDLTGMHPTPAAEHATSLAILSEQKRTGPWRVGTDHTATAVLGSVVLDLREAVFDAGDTTITANAVLGSVEVHVDAETAVVVEGTPVLGDFSPVRDKIAPDLHDGSPVVRIKGVALLGSVAVVRERRPGEKKTLGPRRR